MVSEVVQIYVTFEQVWCVGPHTIHNAAGSCKYLEGPYGSNLVHYSCPRKSHSLRMVLDDGLICRLQLDGMMRTAQSCRGTWVCWGLALGVLLHWVCTTVWGLSSDFWLSIYISRGVLCKMKGCGDKWGCACDGIHTGSELWWLLGYGHTEVDWDMNKALVW